MTQVYYSSINKDAHKKIIDQYLNTFSSAFINKIKKYKRWEDAQLSLIGRLLLRRGLKDQGRLFSDEMLFFNNYGKPYFKDDRVQFNISHSGRFVVCALSNDVEIGIDIELVTQLNVLDFKTQLTDNEWACLAISKNSSEGFLDFWTKKEAVIKANGMGLSIPLERIEVIKDYTELNNDAYFTKEIFIDSTYKCHMAFKGKKINAINTPTRLFF